MLVGCWACHSGGVFPGSWECGIQHTLQDTRHIARRCPEEPELASDVMLLSWDEVQRSFGGTRNQSHG